MNWLVSIGSLFLKAIVEGVISYFRQRERDKAIAHDGAATAELAKRDELDAIRARAEKIHEAPAPADPKETIRRL